MLAPTTTPHTSPKKSNMKQFVVLATLVAMASAMPRYLVIPLEDVDFVGDAPEALPVVPLSRFRRAVEEEPVYPTLPVRRPVQVDRRQDFGPGPVGPPPGVDVGPEPGIPGSFISALQGANIPTAGDNLASGSSSYHAPPKGSDYVDYGAYTGKHGAFGWYTDHPVLLFGHH